MSRISTPRKMQVNFRLTAEESALLKQTAAVAGYRNVSDFIRKAVQDCMEKVNRRETGSGALSSLTSVLGRCPINDLALAFGSPEVAEALKDAKQAADQTRKSALIIHSRIRQNNAAAAAGR